MHFCCLNMINMSSHYATKFIPWSSLLVQTLTEESTEAVTTTVLHNISAPLSLWSSLGIYMASTAVTGPVWPESTFVTWNYRSHLMNLVHVPDLFTMEVAHV